MRDQLSKYLFPAIDGLLCGPFLVLPSRKDRSQRAKAWNDRQDYGRMRHIGCIAWFRRCRERSGNGERCRPKLCNDIRPNRASKKITQLAEEAAQFDRSL